MVCWQRRNTTDVHRDVARMRQSLGKKNGMDGKENMRLPLGIEQKNVKQLKKNALQDCP